MKKSLLHRTLTALALLSGAVSAASAADNFYIETINIEPGETATLVFNLENEEEFYGFQTDLSLPIGLEAVTVNGKADFSLSSRADRSYSIVSNTLSDGDIRVGTFSTSHTALIGNSGPLLYLKVKAATDFAGGTISIANTYFIGADDRDVELPDCSIEIGTIHDDSFYIPDFEISVGKTKTLYVILNNETAFTAFQTDLYLPDGLNLIDNSFKLTSRGTSGHTLSTKSFDGGRTRVVCFTQSNHEFTGNSGALIEFQVTADENLAQSSVLSLKNQIFTKPDAKEYVLPDAVTNVTVSPILAESVMIDSPAKNSLRIGESIILTATVSPEDASDKTVEWTSLNPDVATVDNSGTVTAVSEGEATIKVSTTDGSNLSDECIITVEKSSAIGTIDSESINISVCGNQITISHAECGKAVRLYGINGVLIASTVSNGEDIVFEAAHNTFYIINLGDFSQIIHTK